MASRMPKTLDNINKGVSNAAPTQKVEVVKHKRQTHNIVFEDLPEVEDPIILPKKQEVVEEVYSAPVEAVANEPIKESSVSSTTTYERLPDGHRARHVKRSDVPVENYSERIRTTSFNVYDKEIRKWLRDFSENNQDNGGCSLPQAFILEIVLGILHYDLKIEPNGYRSRDEFIADLKRKMNI